MEVEGVVVIVLVVVVGLPSLELALTGPPVVALLGPSLLAVMLLLVVVLG